MSRRAVAVPILLLAATATGCSTFSDNDSAARVADFELSQDEFSELLVAATPGAEPDEALELSGETARDLLNTWILTRVLEVDLAASDTTVDAAATQAAAEQLEASNPEAWATTPAPMQNLQIEQQAAIATWSALEVPPPSDAELLAQYDAGTAESGFVCGAHILVETEAEAECDPRSARGRCRLRRAGRERVDRHGLGCQRRKPAVRSDRQLRNRLRPRVRGGGPDGRVGRAGGTRPE